MLAVLFSSVCLDVKSGTNSISFCEQVCAMAGKEEKGKASALWNNDGEKFVIQQWHALSVQYGNKIILRRDIGKNVDGEIE